nr:hypothetical protein [Synechococcus sp. RSCCF101]
MPLNLPAGCLGNRRRFQEQNFPGLQLMGFRYSTGNSVRDGFHIKTSKSRTLNFLDDDQLFFAVNIGRKCSATAGSEGWVSVLNRDLNVLRVKIPTSDDDDILASSRDEELLIAVLVLPEESEIACAEKDAGFAGKFSAERGGAEIVLAPVALRHTGAGDPHLSDEARAEDLLRVLRNDSKADVADGSSTPRQRAAICRGALLGFYGLIGRQRLSIKLLDQRRLIAANATDKQC